MTIGESIELMHRARTKVERAKRNQNAHEDIQIMDGLISLVETLQKSLQNSASLAISNEN